MRAGVRFGIDVGKARIGVAMSDHHGMLATPVETVRRGDGDIDRILELAREFDVFEFVVGLPLSLSGASTASTDDARDFAGALGERADIPVRLIDERLSTVAAQRSLHATGRTAKTSRAVIDQAAATILLQHALDTERASGQPAGVALT